MSAQQALEQLRQGNLRFAAGNRRAGVADDDARRDDLLDGQAPFAAVIGCSDSRVPVEIVFDQDLGDLFVIRVAGNIAGPSQIGSVEYAADRFGTRLVVVLGHSRCGAVTATVEQLQQPTAMRSPNLRSIVDRIQPPVEELLAAQVEWDRDRLIEQAVRANIRASVDRLQRGSKLLERLIADDGLVILGAEYSLATGIVEFFDAHAHG